jgi:hypothetical protein
MKQILLNLARINLTNFALQNGINCSGSRVVYDGRFKYSLVSISDGKLLASVRFHKSSVPTHNKPTL